MSDLLQDGAPRLGMGCWAIGGAMTMEGRSVAYAGGDDNQSRRAVAAALDHGVRLFDTAAAYGCGHSERLLGEALRGREDCVIVSKFGMAIDEERRAITGASIDDAPAQIEASLRRLGRERLDVALLHLNALGPDDAARAFDALDPMVEAGKIGRYGWSTDFPASVEAMAARPPFRVVEHAANLFFAADNMRAASEPLALDALLRSPLAMGVLSGKFARDQTFGKDDVRASSAAWADFLDDGGVSAEAIDLLDKVKDLLRTNGRSVAQGALAWLWARSPIWIPIPGARTEAQAIENARAWTFGPLPDDVMAEIERLVQRGPEGAPRER